MIKTESQRRMERGLAAERADREQRQAEERAEQAERERSNAESRRQYLASLESKRAAERARAEARLDQELEPEKTRTGREWLANHPYKSNADFEQVWKQHLRPNAVENLERAKGEAVKASLRASGKYSF
jgi:ribosomal protein L11 methylase PrmA